MYCGQYGEIDGQKDDTLFYIGINLHWKAHYFGLPQLPKGKEWVLYISTDPNETAEDDIEESMGLLQEIYVAPRTIAVYISKDRPIVPTKDIKKEV